jgi:hypothetical protein
MPVQRGRDGPLSINAPRGEPGPAQGRSGAPGSTNDDADDARPGEPGHDPQLRAMRAVWLAMRDEDPPDRGLADLLAAARHKAGAMQPRPGAWQRLLAALRRPPALALATVTVLIAGALLLGRRAPRATAPHLIAKQEDTDPARPATIDRGAGAPAGVLGAGSAAARTYIDQAADHGGAPALPAPPPAAPPPPPTALPPDHGLRPPSPARIAPPPSPSAPGDTRRKNDDRATAGPVPETSASAPPPRETVSQLGASAAVPGTDTAGGNNGRAFARPPRAEPEPQPPAGASNDGRNDTDRSGAAHTANKAANTAANKAANTAGDKTANTAANKAANTAANKAANTAANKADDPEASGVAKPAPRPPPPPAARPDAGEDLSRQCEAAALRGDCAEVRRLVDRISRTDRDYRARVAKDSPVARCLAE